MFFVNHIELLKNLFSKYFLYYYQKVLWGESTDMLIDAHETILTSNFWKCVFPCLRCADLHCFCCHCLRLNTGHYHRLCWGLLLLTRTLLKVYNTQCGVHRYFRKYTAHLLLYQSTWEMLKNKDLSKSVLSESEWTVYLHSQVHSSSAHQALTFMTAHKTNGSVANILKQSTHNTTPKKKQNSVSLSSQYPQKTSSAQVSTNNHLLKNTLNCIKHCVHNNSVHTSNNHTKFELNSTTNCQKYAPPSCSPTKFQAPEPTVNSKLGLKIRPWSLPLVSNHKAQLKQLSGTVWKSLQKVFGKLYACDIL